MSSIAWIIRSVWISHWVLKVYVALHFGIVSWFLISPLCPSKLFKCVGFASLEPANSAFVIIYTSTFILKTLSQHNAPFLRS